MVEQVKISSNAIKWKTNRDWGKTEKKTQWRSVGGKSEEKLSIIAVVVLFLFSIHCDIVDIIEIDIKWIYFPDFFYSQFYYPVLCYVLFSLV